MQLFVYNRIVCSNISFALLYILQTKTRHAIMMTMCCNNTYIVFVTKGNKKMEEKDERK